MVALSLATAALGFAAVPSRTANAPGPGGPTGAVFPRAPAGVTICDLMAMVAAGTYTVGNGNAIGGEAVFGDTSDLQVADDCTQAENYEITQVCQASATFLGMPPAQGVAARSPLLDSGTAAHDGGRRTQDNALRRAAA